MKLGESSKGTLTTEARWLRPNSKIMKLKTHASGIGYQAPREKLNSRNAESVYTTSFTKLQERM